MSSQWLSGAVLAVLALQLSVVARLRGQLRSYAKLASDQSPLLRQLHEWLRGKGSVTSVYRHDYPDVSSEIEDATAIDILAGLSLKTTVAVFSTAIEAALQQGARIRIVCPNPNNSPLMEAAVVASAHRRTGSEAADDVRMHLKLAKNLQSSAKGAMGDMEIRVVDTLPGVGILRIQGSNNTHVYVKMMLIGAAWGGYPVFSLSEDIDENLCADLKRAFEVAWNRSHSYDE